MTAEESMMLRTLWGNFQRYGMRVAVAPPLNYEQANQTQFITLDTAALAGGNFFAQITGRTGTAYSWVERIETAPGTWADGPQSGTLNAYIAEPSTATGAIISTGILVMMRKSVTAPGTFEIYPIANETGNTASEASGSTSTLSTLKVEAVKPLRIRGPATARTIAIIPPDEDPTGYTTASLLTNACPTIEYLSGTVTIDDVPYTVTFALSNTTSTGAVQVQTHTVVQSKPIKVLAGSVGEATCETDPTDCCPEDPCPSCTCEGLTKLEMGENTFTAVAVTSHDGIAEGEFLLNWTLDWLFCPPNGNCSYTITATAVCATYAGTCIDPSFFGSPNVYLEAKSLDAECAEITSIDSDSQDGECTDSACKTTFPTATITIPAAGTDCVRRKINFSTNIYSDTDDAAATLAFVITITEAVCT